MRRSLLVAAAALTFLPVTAYAQEWSPAQKEVWDFEQACWAFKTLPEIMGCFHEDFVGWGIGSTLPTSKADRRPFFARSFETEDIVFLNLKPVEIKVHGNTAVALYLATLTTKNKATGKETTSTERWTDILVKEGGQWAWIADHGTQLSEE